MKDYIKKIEIELKDLEEKLNKTIELYKEQTLNPNINEISKINLSYQIMYMEKYKNILIERLKYEIEQEEKEKKEKEENERNAYMTMLMPEVNNPTSNRSFEERIQILAEGIKQYYDLKEEENS